MESNLEAHQKMNEVLKHSTCSIRKARVLHISMTQTPQVIGFQGINSRLSSKFDTKTEQVSKGYVDQPCCLASCEDFLVYNQPLTEAASL